MKYRFPITFAAMFAYVMKDANLCAVSIRSVWVQQTISSRWLTFGGGCLQVKEDIQSY